jgi:dipeptidase E
MSNNRVRKLFLASWFAGAADLLPAFVSEPLAGMKCVFIPTASRYEMPEDEREGYNKINALDRAALEKHGVVVEELDVLTASHDDIEKSIISADCIFICGGSTFFLIQELKRKCADKLIVHHIEQGKLYMGTSAGSILMQKNIITDEVEDFTYAPELNEDTSGLGIVDFCMYVHYGSHYFGDDDVCYEKHYAHYNAIKVSDKQAVLVSGNNVEVLTAPGELQEVISWLM